MKAAHLLALVGALLLAALPYHAGCIDTGEAAGLAMDVEETPYVPLHAVLNSHVLIMQAVDDLASSGGLSADGAQRFRLLLGGIIGQLQVQQISLSDIYVATGGGMGGPAEQTAPYYSQVLPSRQISLFSNPSAQETQSAAAKEMSVWIDENGGAFVTGDESAPDGMRQINLKQGWEKDYDQLQAQIQVMLAEFMKEHGEESSAAGEQPQPGEQL